MLKNLFIDLIYAGQSDVQSAGVRKQILICTIFTLTAILLLFIFGSHSLLQKNLPLAVADFTVFFLSGMNYFYLRRTGNYRVCSQVIVFIMGALCIYLFCSGGHDNTGPLWSLIMPSLIFFILGLKRGRMVLIMFLGIIFLICLIPRQPEIFANYPPLFIFRFLGVFISISIIAYVYEYTLEDGRNELLTLNKKLDLLSRRDSLTGLSNRRDIIDKIEQEVSRCERNKETFCLLMADVDDFKDVNDNQDHDFGDFVLKKIGSALATSTQKRDCVARWGGEEFLILLSETALEDGLHIAERLRKQIEGLDCKKGEINQRVTLSVGVVQYDKLSTIGALIKLADQRMYVAKKDGKNRVIPSPA